MWLERISGGDAQLIELQDALDHLRIIEADDDDAINRAIRGATAYLDVDDDGFGGLGFPLVSQQWAIMAAGFTSSVLRLPFSRVTSLDEIRYTDENGVAGVVPKESYALGGAGRSRHIVLLPSYSWPSLSTRPDAVEIRFTAGFETVALVPEDIKSAARILIKHFFSQKLITEKAVSRQVHESVNNLVGRYRRFSM